MSKPTFRSRVSKLYLGLLQIGSEYIGRCFNGTATDELGIRQAISWVDTFSRLGQYISGAAGEDSKEKPNSGGPRESVDCCGC